MDSLFGEEKLPIFACPACGEMIRASGAHCPQCGTPIDLQWAQQAAARQDNLNSSFNDANFARNAAQVTGIFFLISFVPVLGGFANWGFVIGMIAVPILVVRWFLKYFVPLQGPDRTHSDLQQGKRRALIALAIWGGLLVLWFITGILYALFGLV